MAIESLRLATIAIVGVAFLLELVHQSHQRDGVVRSPIGSTKKCLLDFNKQESLDIIKPQVFYFKLGGNGPPSASRANATYDWVFDYKYQDNEFRQANIDASLPVKVFTHGFAVCKYSGRMIEVKPS